MRSVLIGVAAFGAAGLELAEAGLLILVLLGAGYRRATAIGAAAAACAVITASVLAGVALLSQVPVTALRLYLGIALTVTGLGLWGRSLLFPGAAASEVAKEGGEALRSARTQLLAGLAAAKIVLIEGTEAALLTVAIGAPEHQLTFATIGTGLSALTVAVAVWRAETLVARLAARVLDKVAGTALIAGGSFWVSDALSTPIPAVIAAAPLVLLWSSHRRLTRTRAAASATPVTAQRGN